MGNITQTVTIIVFRLLQMLQVMIFVRAIMSWFPNFSRGKLSSFLYYTTEPILSPIRSMLMQIRALRNLPMDFSIIGAYLLIEILKQLLVMIL